MSANPQNVQAYKFNFDVTLQKMNLAISFPCKIQVVLKRGTQKIESNQFDLEGGIVKMNQNLNLQTNLYLDMDNKAFLEKKATFTVLIITPKGQKVAGTCQIDLAQYAQNRIPNKNEQLKLEKCPDKNALFAFNIAISMLGQVEFDNISMSSVASKAQDYLTVDDAKGKTTLAGSRQPSQSQLTDKDKDKESQNKTPNKPVESSNPKTISNLHSRNGSQQVNGTSSNINASAPNGADEKIKEEIAKMKKQIEDNQMEKFAFQKKIETLQKSLTEQEDKSKQKGGSSTDDTQLKKKIEEQQALIKKLEGQAEQIKQQADDQIRAKVNEVYAQLQNKIDDLEKTNQQLIKSSGKSELTEKLMGEKKLLMEEISEQKGQIIQLAKELKNAQSSIQQIEILSTQLVKSKQKLGDIYNKAMEIGGMQLYEKLLY